MDELSTLGDTLLAELTEDGEINETTITPGAMGIRRGNQSAILLSSDRNREALSLLRVLSGRELGERRDIVCLNAAPVLYIAGHASDLEEGMAMAGDILDSGKPIEKLRAWVGAQNSQPAARLKRLEKMIELACA
jgi:anthranilate phosphoribosyltransferase